MSKAEPIPTHPRFQDLTGQCFGPWEVVRYAGRRGRRTCWWCRHSDGTLRKREATNLRRRRSRTRVAWDNMIQRCTNRKNTSYADYGGRGIRVCRRWRRFENFLADMGECPPKATLDRDNNDGNYTPGNCYWRSRREQVRNRRRTLRFTYAGRTQSLAAWAEELGISWALLRRRIFVDRWSIQDAVSRLRRQTPGLSPAEQSQRIQARNAVNNALRDGRLQRPACCPQCCRPVKVQAHHHKGYSREHRLDVVWACSKCHARAEAA